MNNEVTTVGGVGVGGVGDVEEEEEEISTVSLVYMECIREGSKLRIKITSPGFHREANCQCPRNIRVEGMKYSVPSNAISFSEGPGRKFFYRISGASIKPVSDADMPLQQPISKVNKVNKVDKNSKVGKIGKVDKVFENEADVDCVICMCNEKDVVFARCGHYVCCEECSMTIFKTSKKCPICRSRIDGVIKRENISM